LSHPLGDLGVNVVRMHDIYSSLESPSSIFAAGSFHTKKLCSRHYSIEVDFYFKKWKEPIRGLRL